MRPYFTPTSRRSVFVLDAASPPCSVRNHFLINYIVHIHSSLNREALVRRKASLSTVCCVSTPWCDDLYLVLFFEKGEPKDFRRVVVARERYHANDVRANETVLTNSFFVVCCVDRTLLVGVSCIFESYNRVQVSSLFTLCCLRCWRDGSIATEELLIESELPGMMDSGQDGYDDDTDDDVVEMAPLTTTVEKIPSTGFETVSMPTEESTIIILHARRLLYVSHFFAQFSEVSWQFCLTLFLAATTDYQSLILVSTYGIATGLAVCIAVPIAGRFIDASNRLRVAQRLIWLENISVLMATVCCFILLSKKSVTTNHEDANNSIETQESWLSYRLQGVPLDLVSILSLLGIHTFGAAAQVLYQAFLVAIERDWVVVLSQAAANSMHTQEDAIESTFRTWLSVTNIAMRQIDLSCKVAAPAVAGLMIPLFAGGQSNPTGNDMRWVCLLIGAVNVLALFVEYSCTKRIYRLIPDLAIKSPNNDKSDDGDGHDDEVRVEAQTNGGSIYKSCGIFQLPHGLSIYMNQTISWAGIALAILYMNALTFGNGILTGYLLYRGMKLELVGTCRGIASVIGLLGTLAYQLSVKRVSLEATGMWSIVYEFGCLALSYGSLFIDGDTLPLTMLILGVCLSRIGLWVFDITVTQLQQQRTPPDVRGVVGGVQQSLNAFFGLLCFTLGVIFPSTKDFHIYASAAFGSVGVAACLYAVGIYCPID
jgi:iron-regulated transporter 1